MTRTKTYSVLIPFEPDAAKRTKWHDATGQALVRGAFTTEAAAHAWCATNIPGHSYRIRVYEDETAFALQTTNVTPETARNIGERYTAPPSKLASELRRWLDALNAPKVSP